MVFLLLFVLLFQLSAVADIPTLNTYATQVALAEQMAHNSDACVTVQLEESSSHQQNQDFTLIFTDGNSAQNDARSKATSLSFERLLFYTNHQSFLKPLWLNFVAIISIPLQKESKIFDVEPLPS